MPKVGVKIDNENVYVDPMILFSRLLVIVEREDNMLKYFKYELTPEPTSLFDNGAIRKATKSSTKFITQDVEEILLTGLPKFVLDGGALLHKVKWFPGSDIQNILNQYSKYISENMETAALCLMAMTMGHILKTMSINEGQISNQQT